MTVIILEEDDDALAALVAPFLARCSLFLHPKFMNQIPKCSLQENKKFFKNVYA